MDKEEILEKLQVFNDDNFVFHEAEHKYFYGDKELTSATTYIGKTFEEKFDENYWSKYKADERQVEQKVVLNEWDKIRTYACDLGTMIHCYIEFKLKLERYVIPFVNDEIISRIAKFERIFAEKLHKLIPVAFECRLFDVEMGIAGTFDALFIQHDQKTDKYILYIFDWKTNKKLDSDEDTENSKYKNYLKGVFSKVYHNKINVYSIQLSLYKLMLERRGIFADDMFIVHIPPDKIDEDGSIINTPAKIHKCKNFTNELKEHFKLK